MTLTFSLINHIIKITEFLHFDDRDGINVVLHYLKIKSHITIYIYIYIYIYLVTMLQI